MGNNHRTVLLIDDELALLYVNRAILEGEGYQVLEAKTGNEGLEIVKTFPGDIDAAILDMNLPDMGGQTVCKRIRELRPNLKVILCSGYLVEGSVQGKLHVEANGFMEKPYGISTLLWTLKEVLGEA